MEMDTGKDSDTLGPRDICILQCPFCENKYMIPCIYRTHLMAHLVYHSDKNFFFCRICPRDGDDIMEIVLHIEKRHSEKRRQNPNSPLTKEVEQQNVDEKYKMIFDFSKCDDETFPLALPY